jgi:cell wall-associated NlpC family hydrolase
MNNKIIEEARSWIGTAFKYHGRIKIHPGSHRGGCDCIGLVMGVASALGLKTKNGGYFHDLDHISYKKSHNSLSLKEFYEANLIAVGNALPGDVFFIQLDENNQHTGFIGEISGNLSLIHAYLQARKIVEHLIPDDWVEMNMKYYRFSATA